MPSPKRSRNTSSKGTADLEEDEVQNSDGGEEMQDKRIMARRADLLCTRQVDLDQLMVLHDDLVCLFSSGDCFKERVDMVCYLC
jgi:hypothetical protein